MPRRLLTRTQKHLLQAPRSGVRTVTKAERLANPDRFSARGDYFVSASIEHVGPRTAFVTKSRWKDVREGVSHATAAKQRAAGARPYKTAASETQAAKTRAKAVEKRDIAVHAREVTEVSRPPKTRRGETRRVAYQATDPMRDSYMRLRNQKLRGEFIDDGEWHGMADIAYTINDPMLSRLLKSA
jgi:hypothetical protein